MNPLEMGQQAESKTCLSGCMKCLANRVIIL